MTTACLETWKNPAAVDIFARQHYLDLSRQEPEFHNYPHARLTRHIAGILAATAIRNGANIDTDILPVAAAYHDADAAIWPAMRTAFAIPEDLAADIAGRDMRGLGMPEDNVESMNGAIRETSRFVPFATDTGRCLSQADLMAGGILSHWAVFLNGTYRLYAESKLAGGQPVPGDRDTLRGELLDFGVNSHDVLSSYLEDDMALGPHQRTDGGASMFNLLAAKNVTLLEPANLSRILEVNLDYIVDYKPVEA